MGWYGDHNIKCPKCLEENAVEQYRNSLMTDYYLVCPDCGLCLYCKEREWIVRSSYINSTLIGSDPSKLSPIDVIDIRIDNCVLTAGLPKSYETVKVGFGWRVFILIALGILVLLSVQYIPLPGR